MTGAPRGHLFISTNSRMIDTQATQVFLSVTTLADGRESYRFTQRFSVYDVDTDRYRRYSYTDCVNVHRASRDPGLANCGVPRLG